MALTNSYATLEELATELGISDSQQSTQMETALNAASRQIDAYTGRRHGFWQDATVKIREYFADDPHLLEVPDGISTTTGLVVKVDINDDGQFATTLTITTDFILLPVNAAVDVPVRPYDAIRIVNPSYYFPRSSYGRPGAQVTSRFGWPTTHPDDVNKACLIQSTQLFKASAATFGAVQLGIDGSVIRLAGRMHPMAEPLLDPFVRRQM